MNRIPSSGQRNKKQDKDKKSLVTSQGCQRLSLVKARQIEPCCQPAGSDL